jgi:hypothetical protein
MSATVSATSARLGRAAAGVALASGAAGVAAGSGGAVVGGLVAAPGDAVGPTGEGGAGVGAAAGVAGPQAPSAQSAASAAIGGRPSACQTMVDQVYHLREGTRPQSAWTGSSDRLTGRTVLRPNSSAQLTPAVTHQHRRDHRADVTTSPVALVEERVREQHQEQQS